MTFTSSMPFDDVDVVFFCFGHGKSEQFLQEHTIPEHVRIIDLAQDFRLKGDHDYVYGLPELNREAIRVIGEMPKWSVGKVPCAIGSSRTLSP